jgi:hypothetical protein
MVAEAGMLIATVAALACLSVAVMGAVLVDYGPRSQACPAQRSSDGDPGTATWSWAPLGVICTYGEGAGAHEVYEHRNIPLGLAGTVVALAGLVMLRRTSLTLADRYVRMHAPVYADDLARQADLAKRRSSSAA